MLENELTELYQSSFINSAGTAYHYTTFDKAVNIINTGQLYLSDFTTLNDPSEFRYASVELFKLLEALAAKSSYKTFWNEISQASKKVNFCDNDDSVAVLGRYGSKAVHNSFVASFSELYDYLPLWRYYGENGAGISLGFDFDNKEQKDIKEDEIVLERKNVYYGVDNFSEWLTKHIEIAERHLSNSDFGNLDKSQQTEIVITIIQFVYDRYSSVKSPDYDSEKEVRLILNATEQVRKNKDFIESIESIKIDEALKDVDKKHVRDNTVDKKSFYKHEFQKSELKEIWIGPRCDNKYVSEYVEALLKKNGYNNTEIKMSEKAYR